MVRVLRKPAYALCIWESGNLLIGSKRFQGIVKQSAFDDRSHPLPLMREQTVLWLSRRKRLIDIRLHLPSDNAQDLSGKS